MLNYCVVLHLHLTFNLSIYCERFYQNDKVRYNCDQIKFREHGTKDFSEIFNCLKFSRNFVHFEKNTNLGQRIEPAKMPGTGTLNLDYPGQTAGPLAKVK